jgi:hypothetical protein
VIKNPAAHLLALAVLSGTTAFARADGIEPGFWKVTSSPEINGNAAPPQVSMRCLSPAEASDVDKTFSPQLRTQNLTCERTEHEVTATTLTWRLRCTGQPTMEVAGAFKFETAQRYTALIVSNATIGEQAVSSRVAIIGERVGDCP